MNRVRILPTVSSPYKPLAVRMATISRTLVVLTVLAVVTTCYFARDILAPVLLAVLFSLLLSPAVAFLQRFRLPRALASAIAVLVLIVLIVVGIMAITEPARDWAAKAPQAIHSVQQRLASWRGPMQAAQKASETIDGLTQGATPASTPQVVVKDQPLVSGILSGTPRFLETLAAVILLLFFCLSSGDNFLRRLVEIAPSLSEKRIVVNIARDIQREISRYLLTITLINFGLGCATAVTLMVLHVPNALLWGAMAFVLNFAPYVGASVTLAVLAVVGLTTFDAIGQALAVPASFLILAFIEGQLVTPLVIGRRLALNPVVVFIWLLLWGLLWGFVGILLAGPLLASFRILCQHTEALRPLYVLIGEAKFEDAA